MKHRVIAALSCALLATGANAQTQPVATTTSPTPVAVTPAPMPQQVVPMIAPAETPSVLRAGTKVPLKMAEALTTKGKNLRVGRSDRRATRVASREWSPDTPDRQLR